MEKLWDLSKLDVRERAALRKSIGQPFGTDAGAMIAFFKALCTEPGEKNKDILFKCMCLECLWRPGETKGRSKMLQEILHDMIKAGDVIATRRFFYMLDISSTNNLLYQLEKCVRLIKVRYPRQAVDFQALVRDLLQWGDPDLKKSWINSIFCET